MKKLLKSATLRALCVICAIALVVTALPVALNLVTDAQTPNNGIFYDFETPGDYDTTGSGVLKKYNDTSYASADVSDGVLKLKNPTSSTFGVSTWVFNSKGSKATFTPGKKYTVSFKWKQAVKTTQSGLNTCWLVVANGAKYNGNALSELSNSSVMPTAAPENSPYGWAGSNTSAPNHRNYSKSNKHLSGYADNFSNADNWQEKTVSFVAYDVTGTAGAKNELAFTVCLSPNQEIHIDDLKVEEEVNDPALKDPITYDFETSGDYDTTTSGAFKKHNDTQYASVSVSDGVLKLKNATTSTYGLSTWVLNSKGSKIDFTPGKKYTISFKWKQAVKTTQSGMNTCWLVVANGAKYSGNALSELSNSSVMPTAGNYGWAGSNTSAPNHRNYSKSNKHLSGNADNFSNADNWQEKTVSFVAYDVTGTAGAKNELAFTVCLSPNQEIHIDDLKVEEYSAPPAISDYVTKFDFEESEKYSTSGEFYGRHTASSPSNYNMFSVENGELVVKGKEETGNSFAVATWVLNKDGKAINLEKGKKYTITFKWKQTRAENTYAAPFFVVANGVNYTPDSGWETLSAQSAIMPTAGDYKYTTSTSAANYRGKNKHLDGGSTGGRFKVSNNVWQDFSMDFVAYDVTSTPGAKNHLAFTICMCGRQTIVIDDIVVVKSPAVSVSFETNGANPIETLYGFPEDDITMPADPVLEGSTFDGWYTDSACQNIFTATKFGSTNVTLYAKWNDKPFTGTVLDFEESEKYSTSGKFYGRHTASSPSNYNMFSVENGELVVKGKEETGNSFAVATWVLNKDGKAINIEKGKKYTITFKWKQTRADNTSAAPWFVVANGVNYTPDSGWAGSSAQSAIMPTAGDYKYTTSTSAANYRGKNKHLDGGNTGGRFKVSNNVWQDFSMDFVAYDVTSTPGAKNHLAFTICMCGRQTIVIDDIVVIDSEVSKVVSINSGSDTKYSPIIAKPGDVVTLPADPKNGEEIFNGWFYDEAYDKPVEIVGGEYKFTMPNGNVSVYALWGDKPDPDVVTFEDEYGEGVTNVNGYSSFGGAFYLNTQDQKSHGQTVNYKADYVKGGKKSLFIDASKTNTNSSVILKNYANKNGFVAKPGEVYTVTLWYKVNAGDNGDGIVLAVAGAEKVVSGWYKITAYSDGAFTFPDAKGGEWKQVTLSYKNTTDKNQYLHLQTLCDGKIDGDAKIYIDDVRVNKLASDESIVNIVKNDGSSKLVYVAKNGTKFTLPKMSDTKYYTFAGWYTDSQFTKAYKGNYTHVKGGLTLYAKWNIKKGVTITESFENYTGSLDGIYSISSAQKTDGNKSLRFEIPETPKKAENYVKIYLDNTQLNVSNGQRFAVSFKYRLDNPPIDSSKQLCMSFYSEGGVQQEFWYNKNKGSQAGMRWWIRTTTITNEWLMFSDIIEIKNIKGSALYFSLGGGNAVSGYIDEITLTPLADDEVAICTDTQYATNMKPYYIGKAGQSYTLEGKGSSLDKHTKFAGWYADETFKTPTEYTGKFKENTKIFGQWVIVKIEQDFENYNGVSGLYKMGSDYEVYNPSVEGYNSENVKNGKTSIHKKGLVHVWQNAQLLNDNQNLAVGVRFTVSFWVKMTNNLHTDGTIKISSCDSNAYPYAYAGVTFDVITIKELSDKEWHKVTFTFDAAGKKFALIAPGYVELFIDDLVFDYTPDATKSESVVPEKEYEPLLRNTDGTLVENEEKIVDPQLLELKNPDNKVNVETENIIETIIGLGTLPMILICAGAVVVLAGIAVAVIFIIKKAKKSPKKS